MNEVSKSRVKALIVLLIVIALVHAVLVGFILPGSKKKAAAETEPEKEVAQSGEVAPPPVSKSRFRRPAPSPGLGKPYLYESVFEGNFPNMAQNPRLALSKDASAGFMVDLNSRNVLWMKNSRKPVPVASMVKMMTLLVTLEEMDRNPEWTLETPIQITTGATKVARTGIIWLDTREKMSLEDLLKAVTIKSANDAAYQVAEFVGNGDVEAFVARMNAKAAALRMPGTKFVSPNGLPDKVRGNSLSTVEGMTLLGEQLLEYPLVLTWASTRQTFVRDGKTELTSTNKLVNPQWPGVNGLKTGFTNDAGYCLAFSCERNGRRIIGCVTGFQAARTGRDPFARALLDWGYQRAAEIESGNRKPPVFKADPVKKPVPTRKSSSTRKKSPAVSTRQKK